MIFFLRDTLLPLLYERYFIGYMIASISIATFLIMFIGVGDERKIRS
jgi:hypothetical protein